MTEGGKVSDSIDVHVVLPPELIADTLIGLKIRPSDHRKLAFVEAQLYEAFKAGLELGLNRFGQSCEKHAAIAGWIGPGPGEQWSTCFGCYMERMVKITRHNLQRMLNEVNDNEDANRDI